MHTFQSVVKKGEDTLEIVLHKMYGRANDNSNTSRVQAIFRFTMNGMWPITRTKDTEK